MSNWKNLLLGLVATVAVVLGCTSAKKTMPSTDRNPDPKWSAIEELERKGQYATALQRTDELLEQAKTAGDWRNEFKAWTYRGRFQLSTGVDRREVLAALEERSRTASGPVLRALLHSLIGTSYWEWYGSERWQVLQRTRMEVPSEDPATWGQAAFMARIIQEMQASLEPYDTLRNIPTGELGMLLVRDPKEGNDPKLRPTVYDVLAYRALDIFRNSETRISEPRWRFQLDDPRYFELFEPFVHRELTHRDSTAWEWQALRIYQRLERLHMANDGPDALVDVVLQRLAFVRERSTLSDVDTRYLQALTTLRSRLPKNDCEAEVMVAMAQLHVEQGGRYQRLAGDAWRDEKRTAAALCQEAIAKWPKSYGARHAESLLQQLQRPSVELAAEAAVPPAKPFLVALSYTNAAKVWVRVVKDPGEEGRYQPHRSEAGWARLLKAAPVNAWEVSLVDDGDLNEHLTELPVEGLPWGRYMLLVSADPGFEQGRSAWASAQIEVTGLALITRHQPDNKSAVLVLDRSTGRSVVGAKAELSAERWRSSGRTVEVIGTATTDADGLALVPVGADMQGSRTWTVTYQGDKASTAVYGWHWPTEPEQEEQRTFLFTDRAIYRPGQEIHFKGIVTVRKERTTEVKSQYRTAVVFTDVNGEEVARQELTTDAYGSFQGVFTAPLGVLAGQMAISAADGWCGIRVEEYKRPTFEVVFDPAKGTPKLDQVVQVTGVAKSYAGVPIDGAQVQWKVWRQARLPWWCGTYWRSIVPWGRRTEVASGTVDTDGTGSFQVGFLAQADPSIAPQADPTFDYTVEATVVDMNGEARTGTTSVSVGLRSIDIDLFRGEAIDRQRMDSMHVQVRNLNGQAVDLPMEVRIERLASPALPWRGRSWERPDRPVLSAEQHGSRFPGQAFAGEDDPLQWPVQATVLHRKAWKAQGRALALDGVKSWDVGIYRITITAEDPSGRTVTAQRSVVVYDPNVRNTGFVNEAFHVEPVVTTVEPGEKAVMLLSSALPEAQVLMELERGGALAMRRWFKLERGQQRIELPALESDRGGFTVHFICVERGQEHRQSVSVDVPWSNKELHVEWMTFRDKLLPGAKEEWRLRITGARGSKVTAQVLAAMYDASLDHFVPHAWDLSVRGSNPVRWNWGAAAPFGAAAVQQHGVAQWYEADMARHYPALNTFGWSMDEGSGLVYEWAGDGMRRRRSMTKQEAGAPPPPPGAPMLASANAEMDAQAQAPQPADSGDRPTGDVPQPVPGVRTDLRETAFFLPDLLTDKDGAVILRFTMPEALTRWKLLGLAHTPDLKVGTFSKETITQKPLMVVPNLPRFLREGDRITLAAKINAIGTAVQGPAKLELFDPFTGRSLDAVFGLKDPARRFSVAPGRSANVAWDLTVPEGVSMVSVRITAAGNGISDGEERPLPVLSDKLLVTESLPLWNNGQGTRTFTLEKLKHPSSTTLRTQSLKLEYTPAPAWYAVQALPYLMEYPHACAEQTFSRFYANTLASSVVSQRPAIKQVFERWKQAGPEAFASALEKNSELKGVLLEETPWVLNARTERENKQRIALLFDLQRMGAEQAAAFKKLREMQLGNGAWPWWSGMRESRSITQHIVAGFGHLERLGAMAPLDVTTQQMVKNAVRWLDSDLEREHRIRMRNSKKEDLDRYVPSHQDVHFLYARSFFTRWTIDGATRTAVDFQVERLKATWTQLGLQQQVLAALALHRLGEPGTARMIMTSLSERATRDEEMGMYWKGSARGYDWWSFPTETHALMIEAFSEVVDDRASVHALRTYLLRLKQTTDWRTTKATSEAIYALLLGGEDWLSEEAPPIITVGAQRVEPDRAEAGTGAFEHQWRAAEVVPAMGEVKVTSTSDRPGHGALHWQYLERMDKITPHESPFHLRKEVFLKRSTDGTTTLVPLSGTWLKAGDLLTVRIELRTDRPVDHVHLKDLRAAALEPTETLSGYRSQGGLGHYRTTRDASVDFFFDRIDAGTYVLEYDLWVAHAGTFSNGITTAMCMYAPEFSAHGAGVRIVVEK